MCECIKLTPLTPEEQTFASENYAALQWCIRSMHLDDDLSGVATLGYLHAVKKWFARPDLRRWSFGTIVRQTIRSHVGNEYRKQKRRIKAVSLDDVIPGTEDLTIGNTVTCDHLNYLKGETETMAMKVNYDIKIPEIAKINGKKSVEIEMLLGFLTSSHKTMCLGYGDKKEAAKKASSLRSWKKSRERTDFEVYRLEACIYVEKGKK